MRWRKISPEIVKLVLENPDRIENKGENNFDYYRNIEGITYKVFYSLNDSNFVIKSAVKK